MINNSVESMPTITLTEITTNQHHDNIKSLHEPSILNRILIAWQQISPVEITPDINITLQAAAKNQALLVLHAIIDALYMAYSMFDYSFAIVATNATDMVNASGCHAETVSSHWLAYPIIFAIFLFEALLFLSLWLIANTPLKQLPGLSVIAEAVPEIRKFCSQLKNGRKFFLFIGAIFQQLCDIPLYAWVNYAATSMGIICLFNKFWLDDQNKKIDEMIKENTITAEKPNLQTEDKLPTQSLSYADKVKLYAASAFDGLADGTYICVCLFGIFSLPLFAFPPAILIVAITTVITFITLSIATKLYDQYHKIQKLSASELGIKIAQLDQQMNKIGQTEKEKNSLIEKRQKLINEKDKLNEDGHLSVTTKIIRSVIMAFKNATVALKLLLFAIPCPIISFTIISTVCIIYAGFLGIKTLANAFKDPEPTVPSNNTDPTTYHAGRTSYHHDRAPAAGLTAVPHQLSFFDNARASISSAYNTIENNTRSTATHISQQLHHTQEALSEKFRYQRTQLAHSSNAYINLPEAITSLAI